MTKNLAMIQRSLFAISILKLYCMQCIHFNALAYKKLHSDYSSLLGNIKA